MKILFCGDIVGRTGRDVIIEHLPSLRRSLDLDFVIVNCENAAAGFGVTEKICTDLFDAGVDVLTGGNHSWDNKDIISKIDKHPRLLRPLNFPQGTPGRGYNTYTLPSGKKVTVVNVMCRLFMDPLDDPFAALTQFFESHILGHSTDAIIIDTHGEASSEKMAMGHFADGRASLVVGTHTHVPTADLQIFPKGTAYQTDAGMCGDYLSVIGMKPEEPLLRFTRKMPTDRLTPAEGPATLCGVYIETDDKTGLTTYASPIRLGGRLSPLMPKSE